MAYHWADIYVRMPLLLDDLRNVQGYVPSHHSQPYGIILVDEISHTMHTQ